MELSGTWRAAGRRRGPPPHAGSTTTDRDDDDWEPVEVPGHWRSHAGVRRHATARCSTAAASSTTGPPRASAGWLRFDGLFYQGDVWLDGAYVGDTEGYFFPHTFEVTEALADRTEHVLGGRGGVRAADRPHRASATSPGSSSTGTASTPTGTPAASGGRSRIETTGPVRIRHLRVLCREADADAGRRRVRAVLDASRRGGATHRAPTIGGTDDTQDEHRWPAGENQLEWTVTVDRARAVVAAGARRSSPCDDVAVEVVDRRRGPAQRPRGRRAPGCARSRMRKWICSVNGERLFLKGANQGPTRMALAEATPERDRARRRLADDGGPRPAARARPRHPARALRRGRRGRACCSGRTCRCSGATPVASASRPCARRARRSTCSATTRRSRSGAATTSRWPSTSTPGRSADRGAAAHRRRCAWPRSCPTWNKTRARPLDQAGPREGRRHPAGHRPLRRAAAPARSSTAPTATSTSAGTTATSATCPASPGRAPAGALRHRVRRPGRARATRRLPRAGALARPRLGAARAHARAPEAMLRRARAARPSYATFDEWRTATQAYQADAHPHHVETLRRLKYRPDRRVRPVLLRRRPSRGHLVGAGPRARCRRPATRR